MWRPRVRNGLVSRILGRRRDPPGDTKIPCDRFADGDATTSGVTKSAPRQPKAEKGQTPRWSARRRASPLRDAHAPKRGTERMRYLALHPLSISEGKRTKASAGLTQTAGDYPWLFENRIPQAPARTTNSAVLRTAIPAMTG